MEILKIAVEWAKAEVFSTRFFIFFAILFIIVSIGFWQLGKTDIAKAYIIPTLVAGVLLLTIGLGLFFTNKSRIKEFETAYNSDSSAFIASEIARTEGIRNSSFQGNSDYNHCSCLANYFYKHPNLACNQHYNDCYDDSHFTYRRNCPCKN